MVFTHQIINHFGISFINIKIKLGFNYRLTIHLIFMLIQPSCLMVKVISIFIIKCSHFKQAYQANQVNYLLRLVTKQHYFIY